MWPIISFFIGLFFTVIFAHSFSSALQMATSDLTYSPIVANDVVSPSSFLIKAFSSFFPRGTSDSALAREQQGGASEPIGQCAAPAQRVARTLDASFLTRYTTLDFPATFFPTMKAVLIENDKCIASLDKKAKFGSTVRRALASFGDGLSVEI